MTRWDEGPAQGSESIHLRPEQKRRKLTQYTEGSGGQDPRAEAVCREAVVRGQGHRAESGGLEMVWECLFFW